MIWMLPSLYLSGLWLARAHFVKYKTFSVGGASSSAVAKFTNSTLYPDQGNASIAIRRGQVE